MKKFLLFKTYHVHLGSLKKKVDHHALEDSFSSGLVCTRTHLLTFVWNSFKENGFKTCLRDGSTALSHNKCLDRNRKALSSLHEEKSLPQAVS